MPRFIRPLITPGPTLPRLLLGAAVALQAGIIQPLLGDAGQAYAEQPSRTYSIAPGALGSALNQFAREAGVVLSFDAALTHGRQTPGLQGNYSVDQGFAVLLRGSGLQVLRTGDNYLLETISSEASVVQLGATSIEAQRLGDITEGTGSYTTGAQKTATKLAMSLRETPQSVTVMTRQRLDDQALADLNDVVQNTPGMVIRRTGPERSTYYARGFALDNLMYDGLPTSLDSSQLSQDLLSADMALYDRVEVVRGATGLMQGAGNPAAAINLIRKRPTPAFQASIQGSAGTWDRYRTDVDLSGPLTDNGTVRGRLVSAYQTQGSFRDALDNERSP